jgi:hypothetical protein
MRDSTAAARVDVPPAAPLAMRVVLFAAVVLLLVSSPLLAHPLKVGFADIIIHNSEVELLLSVNLFEMDLLLSLDRNLNAQIEPEELEAKSSEILEYLRGKIKVFIGQEPLRMEAGPLRIGGSADGRQTL